MNKNADISPYSNVYANLTCSSPTSNFHRTRFNIFNPACFAQPANGQYGTTRSVGSQPMIFQTNFSAIKNFQIYGEHQLQFRVEAFNLFNHPLFSTGGGGVTSPTLGVATSQSNSPRSMQFALRYSF